MANNSEIYWDSEQGYDSEHEVDLERDFSADAGGEALITALFGYPEYAPPYKRYIQDASPDPAGKDASPYIAKEITPEITAKELVNIIATEYDVSIIAREV